MGVPRTGGTTAGREFPGGAACRPTVDEMPRRPRIDPADRARQFMPFAALKGYYDMVRARERVAEPRHELTEEEAARLSEQVVRLRKGDMVRVVRYDVDAYVPVTGLVAQVETALRELTVVKTKIPFDDIRSIEVLGPAGRGPADER